MAPGGMCSSVNVFVTKSTLASASGIARASWGARYVMPKRFASSVTSAIGESSGRRRRAPSTRSSRPASVANRWMVSLTRSSPRFGLMSTTVWRSTPSAHMQIAPMRSQPAPNS